jgi:hypothetical protein
MKQGIVLKHKFVESLPDTLDEKTLYVCMEFATAAHKCCCGCGNEVVTPLSPTDWKLMYDGRVVTLNPSIGNWSFPCRSHYWIRGDRVEWAPSWSDAEVRAGRMHDRLAKDKYFDSINDAPKDESTYAAAPAKGKSHTARSGAWQKIVEWWKK